MGFLDKLIGKEVQKQLNKVVQNISDAVVEAATAPKSANSTPQPAPAAAAPAAAPVAKKGLKKVHNEPFSTAINVVPSSVAESGEAAFGKGKLEAYFLDLVAKNLPELTAQTDVVPESLSLYVEGKKQNVPIVLFRNGLPVIALFLVPSQGYKRAAVVNTMNACEDKGIPAIRFMDSFSNQPNYVIARIKAVMK